MPVATGSVSCSRCGRLTVWDDALDGPVLCVACWDRAAERYNPLAARKKIRKEVSASE